MESEGQHGSPLWSISMDDIGELQEEATAVGWDILYTQNEAGSLDGTLKELRLPGLMVAHEVYGRDFVFCASLPKDFTPALFPLRPRDGVRLNGLPYAAGDIFMPGEVSEIACGGPQGVDLITLHLEPESMSDLSAMLGEDMFDDLLRWAMLRHRGDPRQRIAFEGLLASLLQDAMWPPGANANRIEAFRDKIVTDFAALLEDALPRGVPSRSGRRSVWVRYARQARAYLDGNLDRAVSLAELCRATGTSARTIQYAFRDHYGVAPQVYHRARRLSAVRQSLQQRWPGETTVTDTAFDHGFWHLGRFGKAYKLRFGESPSETLARRPLRPGPTSPFSYRTTTASFRHQIGPPSDRSGKVTPFRS
ncbi:MAG: helix-turn-helix domain-containing protein [Kiloniellales bacterium]|nr:helix-turn-helix domain-containing protein [Kiloniellales bacterium]